VDSAQQIIAEVGPTAATFPSEKCLPSWVGACPGDDESAGINYSHRSPKGNRHMRRLLNQAANAAARTKGSIFEIVYRRSVPHLGHNQAIGAIAHRQCRLIWLILHHGVRYEERGPTVSKQPKQKRTQECSGNSEALAIGSKRHILNPAKPKRSDFSSLQILKGLELDIFVTAESKGLSENCPQCFSLPLLARIRYHKKLRKAAVQ